MGQKLKSFTLALIRKKYLWTIEHLIVVVGLLDPNSYWQLHELRAHNDGLRKEIQDYEERYNRDTKQLMELESNPEAVERVARVDLYMKTANEDVYVLE